jgi:hypothetical protein
MILPKNGRIIIIDDEAIQALPLIFALSKHNIATTYFNAKKETLPVRKFNDVRVVFLDINLNGGQQPNWATEKAMLINNISSIIEPHTPYILFVWSVNEEGQYEDFIQLFNEELVDFRPIVDPIKMEKYNIFKQEVNGDTITWSLNHSDEETIEIIEQKINEGISRIDSFEAIIKWENIVASSSNSITNEIISLASVKGNLNENLKNIYYKLAEAMWGSTIKGQTAEEIIIRALFVFNKMFLDNLDNEVRTKFTIEHIHELIKPEDFSYDTLCLLNTKMLLTKPEIGFHIPGNIYQLKDEKNITQSIVNELKDRSSFYSEFCESIGVKLSESLTESGNLRNSLKSDFNSYFIKRIDDIIKRSVYIGLECTPICDYTQGKRIYPRILPGLLIEDLDYKYFKAKTDSCIITPTVVIEKLKKRFLFEFRYLNTHEVEKIKPEDSILRFREQMIVEIQSKLAGSISRPGVIFLQ